MVAPTDVSLVAVGGLVLGVERRSANWFAEEDFGGVFGRSSLRCCVCANWSLVVVVRLRCRIVDPGVARCQSGFADVQVWSVR